MNIRTLKCVYMLYISIGDLACVQVRVATTATAKDNIIKSGHDYSV